MAHKHERDQTFDGLDDLEDVKRFFHTEPSAIQLNMMEQNTCKKFKGLEYDMVVSPNTENEVSNTDKVLTPQVIKHFHLVQKTQQFTEQHSLKFDFVLDPDETCISWTDKRNIEHDIEVLIRMAKEDRSKKDVVERLKILLEIKKKNDAWLLREYNKINKQFGLTSKRFDFGNHQHKDFETKIKLLDKTEISQLEYDATRLHWMFTMKPDNVVYQKMKIGENLDVLEQRYKLTQHILKLYHKLKKT